MMTNLTLRVIPAYRTLHDFYVRRIDLTSIPDQLRLNFRDDDDFGKIARKNVIPTTFDLETYTYHATYDLHLEDKYLSALEKYLINTGWQKQQFSALLSSV